MREFALAQNTYFLDGMDHTDKKIRAANVVFEKARRERKQYLCTE
jgi:hypothetical protein